MCSSTSSKLPLYTTNQLLIAVGLGEEQDSKSVTQLQISFSLRAAHCYNSQSYAQCLRGACVGTEPKLY